MAEDVHTSTDSST